ncbi:hypothetical protein BG000_003126, partial [Podila horticola]
KQWLSNLQAKVEYLSTDNEHLQAQTAALRDEIIHLKALLLAHKDCPVAQANGVYGDSINIGGMVQQQQQQQMRQQPQPRGSLPPQQHPQSTARMVQDITPNASPSQSQASLRY